MKRILFSSDGIWTPSGFGTVMYNLISRLKDDFVIGHQAWQYVGNVLDAHALKPLLPKSVLDKADNMVKIYPINKHEFGKDTLGFALKDFKPDVIITLGDYWMCNYLVDRDFQEYLKANNIKWYWYLPIDCHHIPIVFEPLFKPELVDKIITMANHGNIVVKEAIENRKIRNVNNTLIPHGVNTKVYRPLAHEEKMQLRAREYETLEHNDKFIIGSVARNQERKLPHRLVEAFAKFAKGKDDVLLHMHCDPDDPAGRVKDGSGLSYPVLKSAIHFFGVMNKVKFSSGVKSYVSGINTADMNYMYNLFDIHTTATTGEGFGIPMLESISAGVPNVQPRWTSMPELIGDDERGTLVDLATKVYSQFGTYRGIVDVDKMAEAFEFYYQDWKNGKAIINEQKQNCVKFSKNYDWDAKIIPKWKEALKGV